MDKVTQEFYLTLSPNIRFRTHLPQGAIVDSLHIPKVTKNAPSLNRNEICMKLKIEVPASLFLKPSLEASISIPDDAVSPVIINPEVQDNIKDIIKRNTGLDLNITVVNPSESE